MDPSRRFFLRGGLKQPAEVGEPRPPWALAEPEFVHACTRCNACIDACPQHILSRGDGGFPTVKFESNGCNECERCVVVCLPKALVQKPGQAPWRWRADIGNQCLAARRIECRVCGEVCDAGAIRFKPTLGGVAQPVMTPDACTGCGQCVPICPTRAIQMKTPAN